MTIDIIAPIMMTTYKMAELSAWAFRHLARTENLRFKCVTDVGCKPPSCWEKCSESLRQNDPASITLGLQSVADSSDADYIIICHADVIVLKKHWDVILTDLLSQFVMAGIPYYNGLWPHAPSTIFLAMSQPEWKKMSICLSPKINQHRRVVRENTDELTSAAFRVPLGTRYKIDTGHQIPIALYKRGLEPYLFESRSPSKFKHYRTMPDYYFKEELFLAHYGAVRTSTDYSVWTQEVGDYLRSQC